MAIQIILNGQPRVFAEPEIVTTIAQLIATLDLKADRVAVEHNGVLAPRKSWPDTPLGDGDRVELVHFVGGGSDSQRAG